MTASLRLAFMSINMTEAERAALHREADKIEGEQAELVTALRGAMDCASHTMYTKEGVGAATAAEGLRSRSAVPLPRGEMMSQTQKERDAHEQGWSEGNKAAYLALLREAIGHLGGDDKEANAERWRIERCEVVAMLRLVCAEYGDNDWPDELHLADVIEKHLWRNLPELEEEAEAR